MELTYILLSMRRVAVFRSIQVDRIGYVAEALQDS